MSQVEPQIGLIEEEHPDSTSGEVNTAPQATHNEVQNMVHVAIMTENKTPETSHENLKRTPSQLAPEYPAKRKRGRPRKKKPPAAATITSLETTDIEASNVDKVPPEPQTTAIEMTNPLSNTESLSGTENNLDASECVKVTEVPQQGPSEISDQPAEKVCSSYPNISVELEEIIVPNISTPHSLVSKILEIDGRMKGARTANAWKEIRCYRRNQDMGSLWDVRQAWYFRQK